MIKKDMVVLDKKDMAVLNEEDMVVLNEKGIQLLETKKSLLAGASIPTATIDFIASSIMQDRLRLSFRDNNSSIEVFKYLLKKCTTYTYSQTELNKEKLKVIDNSIETFEDNKFNMTFSRDKLYITKRIGLSSKQVKLYMGIKEQDIDKVNIHPEFIITLVKYRVKNIIKQYIENNIDEKYSPIVQPLQKSENRNIYYIGVQFSIKITNSSFTLVD